MTNASLSDNGIIIMVCKIEVVPEPYFESILKSLTDPAIVHS